MSTSFSAPSPSRESARRLLLRVLGGAMASSGTDLGDAIASGLGEALGAERVLVCELLDDDSGRARTLARWPSGGSFDDGVFDLAGTPCERVAGEACTQRVPGALAAAFPADARLAPLGLDGYLGIPLPRDGGGVAGVLSLYGVGDLVADAELLALVEMAAARIAADLAYRRRTRELADSERRFRDLFEEAPIAYVYEDTETRFVSANRAFTTLLGIDPDQVRGMYGRSLLAPTSETHMMVDDAFADIQQGKERGRLEFELRRKDNGKPVWVQFWSRPEPDGKHTRTMILDITDRVMAERESNRLRQQNRYLREEIKTEYNFDEIVGGSPGIQAALVKVRQVAPTTSTVLVLGETGTGKELIARAIHNHSSRRDKPLIKLNCAALPTGLIESELFGHEKGAFTGALERRVGRFALADGGTIFLDEIGDVPPDVQVRLLRVLQEQEFEPVGSTKTIRVDVRVIAATNRDLAKAIASGAFRSDLFYRLNVFPIAIPPLRERRGDIPLLAHYFVQRHAAKIGRAIETIAPTTMERLVAYGWPGNIRELENVIERAVILAPGPVLEVDPAVFSSADQPAAAAENETDRIRRALGESHWVIEGERGAAKVLGLHPNTLRSRMKKLGIRRQDR